MKTWRGDDIGNNNRPHSVLQDCLFLSLVVLLSLILYVQALGFYSDDWAFLGLSSMSADKSLLGLFKTLYNPPFAVAPAIGAHMRPLQLLYFAGLYSLFDSDPLGYHLVNGAVLLSSVVLFYLVLCEVSQQRVLNLAVAVVYALLPHYSTDRFWVAAFQANLSMALYFLSLYSDLRAVRGEGLQLWGWKLLSILSLVGSTLAYELVLPLFLFNLLLVWYRRRQLYDSVPGRQLSPKKLAVLFGSNLLALIVVIVFKALTTNRIGHLKNTHILWFGWHVAKAFLTSYGEYGLGLPAVIFKILRDYPNWLILAMGVVVGSLVFWYLYRAISQSQAELPNQTIMLRFIVWGLVVFGLGYAIFLINRNAENTATGIGNRIAIAAAAGVSLSMVGGLGWVSNRLRSDQLRRRFFCILVALLCTSGFLINNTLASFWITAYGQVQAVIADIRQEFPTLPTGSTLILDGVCPYVGPAIVFESNWDLTGVLMMLYRDYTLRADVVTPNLKVREEGLSTLLYGGESHYPYKKMFIYHFGRKMTYPLTDAASARRYFQTFNPDHNSGCPQGSEAYGVRVF